MSEAPSAKTYEIQQQDETGTALATQTVTANSGDAAARQLDDLVAGVEKVVILLDGSPVNEMGADFWLKRVRRR